MLFNSALNRDIFKDSSLRKSLWVAKITKVGHLISEGEWILAEIFAEKLSIKSIQVAKKILTQIAECLPKSYRLSVEMYNGEMDIFDFPELEIAVETESWEETEGGNLLRHLSCEFSAIQKNKITVYTVYKDIASPYSCKRKGV